MSYFVESNGKHLIFDSFSNDDVIGYLASKFNTITPRFMVLAKSVFLHVAVAKFDNVSFAINAAGTTIELAFSEVDAEKMSPVIEALKKWSKFSSDAKPFCVQVDRDGSRSILFESGLQERGAFKHRFGSDVKIIDF